MESELNRREFIKTSGAAAMVVAATATSGLATGEIAPGALLPARPLGSNGYHASILGLGGEHLLSRHRNDAAAEELVNRALDLGVNYFDTAQLYFPSERYLGQALKGRREQAFVSSKIDPRDPEEAKPLIERSLKLLQSDYLDNLSVHRVRDLADVDRITSKGGLMDLMMDLKRQGVLRNVGITGHYTPEALVELMRRGEWNSVLLPVNPTDAHHLPFLMAREEARRHGMAIIAMKVSARGRFFSEGGITRMDDLLTYALTQDVDVAIVGMENLTQLEDNVRIAKGFQPMPEEEQRQLEARLKPYTALGNFYKPGGAGWHD
jgi:predicted aldo/keto reductase-like oxidoreductase